MSSIPRDYSVFNKFNFERKPVGVKFLLNRPEGIKQLDKGLALCEMFKEAQNREPFYAAAENFTCLGSTVLGMKDFEPLFEAGQIGPKEGIYREARANRRIYDYLPTLKKDTVRYVAFSPVDQLTFDPDLLIVTASVSQAEIIFRAMCYSTGKMMTTKTTPVVMCAWLFVYPFVSGEMNYTVSGLGYGMKSRKVLPEGLMLISIPYDLLPGLTENLQDMQWVLTSYTLDEEERMKYLKKVGNELRQEYQNG